jgi:hypothetical protein
MLSSRADRQDGGRGIGRSPDGDVHEAPMKTKTLAYDTVSTRLGSVYIACTEFGLAMVQIGGSAAAWRRQLRKAFSAPAEKRPAAVRRTAIQIREYLQGKRRSFRGRLDWRSATSFRRRVSRRVAHSLRPDVHLRADRGVDRQSARGARGRPSAGRQSSAACHPVPPGACKRRRVGWLQRGGRGARETKAVGSRAREIISFH